MRWTIFVTSLATLASATQITINPFRPAQHDVLPGASLTADSELKLSSIGSDFTEITHAAFPTHKVKIKETTGWCDPDVRSYSGYINTGHGRDLFFYFFESRSSPKTDPVLTWINGGPGCSSSLGLFMELGPCTIADPSHINGTKVNPYSWNNNANVIFLEQPIGVSFSYGKHGQTTSTTEEAAVDVQAFVSIFFQTFKEFKGREYFMSGESYGGRYLPVFASAILDGNKDLVAKGLDPINLKGVLIGNGITDAYRMMSAYYTYQCVHLPSRPGHESPINSIANCVQMAKTLPICEEMLERDCLYRTDRDACAGAFSYCASVLEQPFFDMNLNPYASSYDISKSCNKTELEDGLCYGEITGNITKYMDLPELRKFLGVEESANKFASCSNKVSVAFNAALDESGKTWLYLSGLIERGVQALIYVGTNDWICNFVGNEAMVEQTLQWSGQRAFGQQSLREWTVDGKSAGTTKSYGPLTFATVYGAGHMVPYDKPKQALQMLNTFLQQGGAAL
ncbi:hypothetical protein QFC22_003835 [Naganishia vaughanmartiniae]|uniref:Uncharacterized protein n=1 Tax=Naganishia vaughanmartiniae TaxID=1424756 RepID=A0ACC2X3J5_9TREE|nr:hypothetical protein QFC22_003835 [Naganishia vaughanmartiniae]